MHARQDMLALLLGESKALDKNGIEAVGLADTEQTLAGLRKHPRLQPPLRRDTTWEAALACLVAPDPF